MVEWLAARSFLGLARGWLVLAAVAGAATALALWLSATERADDRANQQIGAAAQRTQDLQVTLDRTEQANATRAEIRDPASPARYQQCLRTARTPGNCQRFLPRGAPNDR